MPLRHTEYFCTSCGARNVTSVDLTAGSRQIYVEDCEICCRPNALTIHYDEAAEEIEIHAEPEN